MPDAADLEVERALDALNPNGNREIIGIDITGRARLLVGRGDQQPRGVGLEVELLIDIEHRRPGIDRHAHGSVDERGGTAQGAQAERRCTARDRELIGPRARGVDEHGRCERLGIHPQVPRLAPPLRGAAALADVEPHSKRLALPQKALQQGGDIDVVNVALVERSGHISRAQPWHPRERGLDGQPLDRARGGAHLALRRLETLELIGTGEVERAPHTQQRMRREALRG